MLNIEFNWTEVTIIVGITTSIFATMLGIVSHFIKKWMQQTDDTTKTTATALASVVLQHSKDIQTASEKSRIELSIETAKIATDVKEVLKEHRDDDRGRSNEIKTSIDKLSEHVAIANGRTGKLEVAIKEITTRCEERSKVFYIETKKMEVR